MRLTRNPRADGGRRCGQFSAAPSEHLAACPQAGRPDAITQAAPVGSDVREIAAAPHVYGEPPRDAIEHGGVVHPREAAPAPLAVDEAAQGAGKAAGAGLLGRGIGQRAAGGR